MFIFPVLATSLSSSMYPQTSVSYLYYLLVKTYLKSPWQQLIYLPSNLVLLQACKSETQGVTLGSFLCLNLHIQMLSMLSSKCLLNSYHHPHYYHRVLSLLLQTKLHHFKPELGKKKKWGFPGGSDGKASACNARDWV